MVSYPTQLHHVALRPNMGLDEDVRDLSGAKCYIGWVDFEGVAWVISVILVPYGVRLNFINDVPIVID
jgi:hypothetical protein